MPRGIPIAGIVLFGLLTPACSRAQYGLPRVAVSAVSPDGRVVAFVRNHVTIDPPDQSPWLREGTSERFLRKLGADADWSDEVAWSPDSRHVAFLVRGVHVLLYRVSDQAVSQFDLFPVTGSYPEPQVVKQLRYDGNAFHYLICDRIDDPRKSFAKDLWDATVAQCRSSMFKTDRTLD